MSIAPLTFTGISQFSNDFQTILNRAVSIAALPVTALQNRQADLLAKKQLATGLSSALASLAASVTALGAIGQSQALAAFSSDSTLVAAANTGASAPASYEVSHITSVATSAAEASLSGYDIANTTAVSSTGNLNLIVGSTSHLFSLAPGQNNLSGLRDAINALGAGVTASILTTGTGLTPNYLSVSANATGANAIALKDDPTPGANIDLLTASNPGANAAFQLNGVAVTRSANTVNDLIPGLTLTIAGTTTGGQTATVTLASDPAQISGALNNLASSYNAVVAQLNAQIGPNAGLLSGDVIVRQAQTALRQLTGFQGAGDIQSLAALGISLSNTGQMSFDPTALNSLSGSQISSAFTFLGSATTGLGALASQFTQLTDPFQGLIQIEQDQFDRTYQALGKQVDILTQRVNAMQASLSKKLQGADALLASLASQQQILTASIQGLTFTSFGASTTSNGQTPIG